MLDLTPSLTPLWLLIGLQHRRHFLMDQVDGFKRPDQHLEVNDPAFVIPLDHVNTVDNDAVNLDFKLQRRIARTADLPDIVE